MDLKVTAEEMVQELTNQVAQLYIQLAASQILIRKLQEENNGETHGQETGQIGNGLVRDPEPAGISDP